MPLNPQSVHQRLHKTALLFRWTSGARFLISGAAGSLFFLMVFLLCDTQFHFGAVGRWFGFLLTVLSLLLGVALALPALFKNISDASIARRIERACTGSRNVLINAVQFDSELAAGSSLRAALFEEMEDPFKQVRWREVFDLLLLKRLALTLAGIAALITLWGVIRPAHFVNSAERIFLPASNIAPLTRTQIKAITPGDVQIVHGGGVVLKATLGGDIPTAAWVNFRPAGSGWQKVLLDRDTGQPDFAYEWKDVVQPIEYYIEAGDARSATYTINVRPRTVLRSRSAEITPPAYTKLAKNTVRDFTALQDVIPGSRIAFTLEFNAAVNALHATSDKGEKFAVKKLDGTHWQIEGRVTAPQIIKLAYHDATARDDEESQQITVKPVEPPKINITNPQEGNETVTTRSASLPLQFTASDTFGLASVALYKSTNDKPNAQLIREWKEAADRKTFTTQTRIDLLQFTTPDDDHATFCLVAKDRNDVTGPGVTISRPIVVTLRSGDALQQQVDDAGQQLSRSLGDLIKLQQTNLDETRAASSDGSTGPEPFAPLLDRQIKVASMAAKIAVSAAAITPEIRGDLRALGENEMKSAVLALRNAGSSAGDARAKFASTAINIEAAILARLRGAPAAADAEAQKGRIQDLIASVDHLLHEQRDIFRETNTTSDPRKNSKPLSDRQDALSGESVRVRKEIGADSQNAALGDDDFRARLTKVFSMFTEFRIYEEMLTSADKLQAAKFPEAAATEKGIVVNLAKIVEFLNQWQLAKAAQSADAMKKEAAAIKDKLEKLATIQRDIVEKSKELAHKDQFRPEDQATAKAIKDSKDLIKEQIEQMLTDAHIFPDLKPSNELRSELTQIYEDVEQADKQEVAEGKLKPQEIAVQKEDGILKAIEEAKKIAADMEMWLPNKNETTKWDLENFDKTEMPEIPNLPLPDEFEDIVGKLLDEQKNIADQVQDAASNQAAAQNAANGWEIRDGPMPGFGAQGKSGNERPNKNEQTGRSSGGREGESDGEMVGDRADNLEGTKPDARRTNDPMQQGQVKDDGGIASTRATGGGKAGGFSDRNGMDGNAPLRSTKAAAQLTDDALAVKEALLAEKTSRHYAQASLLYLRTGAMAEVVRLMDDSQLALKEGRVKDFENLHQQITARLNEIRGEIHTGETMSLPGDSTGTEDKQLLGGDEGSAPERYKKQVADYYRSLAGEK
ncbi:MAG: hypothetical protein WCD79_07025 [Chthoniobacteraceae bacterium]